MILRFTAQAGRFAADGFSALALDLLSEEGGTAKVGDEAQAAAALSQIDPKRFDADMKAAVSELRRRVRGSTTRAGASNRRPRAEAYRRVLDWFGRNAA